MKKLNFLPFLVLASIMSYGAYAQNPTFEIQDKQQTTAPTKKKITKTEPPKLDALNDKKLLTVDGAAYTGMPYVKDDNPAGYTQTYLRFNFERPTIMDKKRYRKGEHGEKENIGAFQGHDHFSILRNFFAQVLYSTNANNLPAYANAKDTSDHVRYVNKLDLYKYSNFSVSLLENLLTISNLHTTKDDWQNKFYIDLKATYLRTGVTDSPAKTTPTIVNTWLLGANAKLIFTNNNNFTGKPISLECGVDIAWANPMTNTFNSDLNFQYENRADYKTQLNPSKPMLTDPYAYYHFDFLARIGFKDVDKTNDPKKESKSNVFFHLGYTSNLASSTASKFYNSYLVAQIGIGIDISKAVNSIADKDKTDTKPATDEEKPATKKNDDE